MMINITGSAIEDGKIHIYGTDVSDERLQYLERTRSDGFEQELEFVFDTTLEQPRNYIRKWLKSQKRTKDAKTWGDAVRCIVGTIVTINGKYRAWD